MSIITLPELKSFLELDSEAVTEDNRLNMMISFVEANIKQYCRQNFIQQTYTEFYSGTGTRMIFLRQRPVQSIVNVWLDNYAYYGTTPTPFASDTLLENGVSYALALDETLTNGQVVSRSGLLTRVSTLWPELNPVYFPGRLAQEYGPAYGNIKVTYVAGYPTAAFPADIKAAACVMVSAMRRGALAGGLALISEGITDYTYTFGKASTEKFPELGSARQILNRYRELPIGS